MGGFSESSVILVVVPMGVGETLHRSPRNADSFRFKRRAFRLVPSYGGLLVSNSHKCRPNVADDVISSMAVDSTGMGVRA